MSIRTKASPVLLAVGVLALAAAAAGQQYELSWWTADGGGITFAVGGPFDLGGTIGQPDAGPPASMTGGDFQLIGGFWPGAIERCALPGDLNRDGLTDGDDLQGFVECILDSSQAAGCSCADLDGNGIIDAGDAFLLAVALLGP